MRASSRSASTAVITAVITAVAIVIFSSATSHAATVPTPSPNAPPAGLHASAANTAAVVAAWRKADGTSKIRLATEVETDAVTAYGLSSVTRIVTAGDDYRETDTLGPITTQFGSVKFDDFLGSRIHGHTSIEGEDQDGLVGNAILRFFTVTLDYRNGTIYLKRGSKLTKLKAAAASSPHP